MKLYHGTNGAWTESILKHGLRPRASSSTRGNWDKFPSNRHCVYLTDSYAPYFAFAAARGKHPECAVFEIDTERLNEGALYPDEDALEQGLRGHDDVAGDHTQRSRWYRRHLLGFGCLNNGDPSWPASLEALGTCAHLGVIKPRAITRVARWPHQENLWLALVWDPTISVINQQLIGARYKALTAKLFGHPLPPLPVWTDTEGNPIESSDQRSVDAFEPSRIKRFQLIETAHDRSDRR